MCIDSHLPDFNGDFARFPTTVKIVCKDYVHTHHVGGRLYDDVEFVLNRTKQICPDYRSITVYVKGKSMCGSMRGEK